MVYVLLFRLRAKQDNFILSIYSSLLVGMIDYENFENNFFFQGSGIGFMAIAGLVADIFFMHIHKARNLFRDGKFSVVDVNDKDSTLLTRP